VWETTATLRLLGGARGAGAPTGGGEGQRGRVSPCVSPCACVLTVFIYFLFFFECVGVLPFDGEIKMYIQLVISAKRTYINKHI